MFSMNEPRRYIVGFTGRKGSGKTTAAQAYLRLGYSLINFADTLKGIARSVFDLTEEQTDGDQKEEQVPGLPDGWTPRRLMQLIGTETGRQGDFSWAAELGRQSELEQAFARRDLKPGENCWVDGMKNHLMWEGDTSFVVADVRFPNELDMIRKMGGVVWRVERPSMSRIPATHPSEQFIDTLPVEATIQNDSTVEEFLRRVRVNHARFLLEQHYGTHAWIGGRR